MAGNGRRIIAHTQNKKTRAPLAYNRYMLQFRGNSSDRRSSKGRCRVFSNSHRVDRQVERGLCHGASHKAMNGAGSWLVAHSEDSERWAKAGGSRPPMAASRTESLAFICFKLSSGRGSLQASRAAESCSGERRVGSFRGDTNIMMQGGGISTCSFFSS